MIQLPNNEIAIYHVSHDYPSPLVVPVKHLDRWLQFFDGIKEKVDTSRYLTDEHKSNYFRYTEMTEEVLDTQ